MFSFWAIMDIIFIHWFADFVCQTHWMATNKSKNNKALLAHVGVYTGVLFVLALFFSDQRKIFAEWALLNGLLHFCTDYITSRITSKLYAKGDYHNFFVVIGLDQVIHYACLFGTMYLFYAAAV